MHLKGAPIIDRILCGSCTFSSVPISTLTSYRNNSINPVVYSPIQTLSLLYIKFSPLLLNLIFPNWSCFFLDLFFITIHSPSLVDLLGLLIPAELFKSTYLEYWTSCIGFGIPISIVYTIIWNYPLNHWNDAVLLSLLCCCLMVVGSYPQQICRFIQ